MPADIIFVDSPINVGFSYSDDPRDRVYDEATVADDLLDFMQVFLKGDIYLSLLFYLHLCGWEL